MPDVGVYGVQGRLRCGSGRALVGALPSVRRSPGPGEGCSSPPRCSSLVAGWAGRADLGGGGDVALASRAVAGRVWGLVCGWEGLPACRVPPPVVCGGPAGGCPWGDRRDLCIVCGPVLGLSHMPRGLSLSLSLSPSGMPARSPWGGSLVWVTVGGGGIGVASARSYYPSHLGLGAAGGLRAGPGVVVVTAGEAVGVWSLALSPGVPKPC